MSYDTYPAGGPQPAGEPVPRRWTVDGGRYWAGVAATAVVTAVIGVVGTLICEGILNLRLLPPRLNLLGLNHHSARYALAAAVAAVLAGALFQLLLVSTPRPDAFFTWIIVLLTIAAAVVPFAVTDDVADAFATGLLNAIIGIAVLTLLRGVAARTRRLSAV